MMKCKLEMRLKLEALLTFYTLPVSLRTARFNIQTFHMVVALCSVFCTDLRTNSDFRLIHH